MVVVVMGWGELSSQMDQEGSGWERKGHKGRLFPTLAQAAPGWVRQPLL